MDRSKRGICLLILCICLALACAGCQPYKRLTDEEVAALVQKTIELVQNEDSWQQSFVIELEDKQIGYDKASQTGYALQKTKNVYYLDDMAYEDDIPADTQTKAPFAFGEVLLQSEAQSVFGIMQKYVQQKYIVSQSGKAYKNGGTEVTVHFRTEESAYALSVVYAEDGAATSINLYTANTAGYKVADVGFFGGQGEAIQEVFPADLAQYERVE